MFAMVRAHWIDVGGMSTGFGAGPSVADPWLEGLAARSAQNLRSRQAQRDALPRAQGQHPLSRILARRHALADGGLPARGAAHERAVRQIRQATRSSTPSSRSSTRPSASAATSWRSSRTASTRRALSSTMTASSAASGVPIHGQGHDRPRQHDDRSVRLLGRAQGGDQLAHLCGRARRLQGADRPARAGQRRLVPRARRSIIPEGNIMMARYPAPMSGWSMIVPTVVDTIVKALGRRHAGPRAGRRTTACSAARSCSSACIRRPSAASSCRASRAAAGAAGPREDGESGTRLGLPGRRAQRLDRGHRAEMPGAGREPRAAHRFRRRRQASRRPRHRYLRCAISSTAAGISITRAASNARPGACGAASPARTAIFCCGCPARTISAPWTRSHYPVPVNSEVIVRTGGGGGWGDPLERDAALVRADVIEELVSRRAAEELYGVVLRDDLTLDEAATARRRNALRSAAKVGRKPMAASDAVLKPPRLSFLRRLADRGGGRGPRRRRPYAHAVRAAAATAAREYDFTSQQLRSTDRSRACDGTRRVAAAARAHDVAGVAADLLRVGNVGAVAFSFVPTNVGKETGIFAKNGLDVQITGFGGDAKLQQAMAAARRRCRAWLRPRHGLHRQGLAGQGDRRHCRTAAHLRARGARRRLGENHRRPQRPQGRHFHRRLGDKLADERSVAPARLGLRPDSSEVRDRRQRRAPCSAEGGRHRRLRGRRRLGAQLRRSTATAAS